jgi:hypothetical protein
MNDESNIITKDSLLITNDAILNIALFTEDIKEFNKGTAYINNGFYYILRGKRERNKPNDLYPDPGIYIDQNGPYIIEPYTEDDKHKFSLAGKINTINHNEIIDMINKSEQIFVNTNENVKKFLLTIDNTDDILKRIIKKALLDKDVDIDSIKSRFTDSNSWFNFKQSIKKKDGTGRFSILLFDRGMEALNLKYTIIVEEKDNSSIISKKLHTEIKASSEDTFEE